MGRESGSSTSVLFSLAQVVYSRDKLETGRYIRSIHRALSPRENRAGGESWQTVGGEFRWWKMEDQCGRGGVIFERRVYRRGSPEFPGGSREEICCECNLKNYDFIHEPYSDPREKKGGPRRFNRSNLSFFRRISRGRITPPFSNDLSRPWTDDLRSIPNFYATIYFSGTYIYIFQRWMKFMIESCNGTIDRSISPFSLSLSPFPSTSLFLEKIFISNFMTRSKRFFIEIRTRKKRRGTRRKREETEGKRTRQ